MDKSDEIRVDVLLDERKTLRDKVGKLEEGLDQLTSALRRSQSLVNILENENRALKNMLADLSIRLEDSQPQPPPSRDGG